MIDKEVFNKEFLELNSKVITEELNKNGYFSFDKALSDSFINKIKDDVTQSGLSLNKNNVAGVYFTHGHQFFLTHMLAVSKTFFNYCTNNKVFEICTDFLGNKFRLKALRYYENFGGQVMQWHTDNRYYDGVKKDGIKTNVPGLIFIAYISDVNDGEFQYIRGSHKWSLDDGHNDYSQDYINKNYKNDIVGFKKPRGSVLIYASAGIHRAKPSLDKNLARKTLFFQVDTELNLSEPILVKTEFIDRFDEKMKMYLGFGKKTGMELYPKTSLDTLPLNKRVFSEISKWLLGRLANKLPGFIRKRIRKVLK
jgi:hypothetical protein